MNPKAAALVKLIGRAIVDDFYAGKLPPVPPAHNASTEKQVNGQAGTRRLVKNKPLTGGQREI